MIVVVFPVPGGPWIRATSFAERARVTAFFCDSSNPLMITIAK